MEIRNPSPLAPGVRLPAIDALKGFAMVLVVLYHAGGVLNWDNWFHGEVGVDVFLIVSGFTLVLTSRKLPAKQFVMRRMARIFPAYWVALACFVVLKDWAYNLNYSATSVTLHAFGIHGFVNGEYFSDINDSFWFVSMILAMYGVFLALRQKLEDLSYIAGVGMIITVCACYAYIAGNHTGGLIQLAVRIPSFFLGLLAGQVLTSEVSTLRFSPHLVVGLLAMTYLGWTKGVITFYAVAGAGLTSSFLLASRFLGRLPEGRFVLKGLSVLGIYSYEFFLIHQPLIWDFNYYVYRNWVGTEPTRTQLSIGIVIALAVTYILSVILHKSVAALYALLRKQPAGIDLPKAHA